MSNSKKHLIVIVQWVLALSFIWYTIGGFVDGLIQSLFMFIIADPVLFLGGGALFLVFNVILTMFIYSGKDMFKQGKV